MREILFRGGELLSLGSCTLNVIMGTGDREVTLSAGSWDLRGRGGWSGRWGAVLVTVIDALRRLDDGPDHCRRAWVDHADVWPKVRRERAA